MVKTLLLRAGATLCLWLAILLPVVAVAVWTSRTRLDKRVLLFIALIYVDLLCVMAPPVGAFQRLDWNWQGKILEGLWVLLLAALPGFSLARLGIRARLEPGSVIPVVVISLLAAAIPMVFWLQGMRMYPDRETLAFEWTMPGLAEEMVFRGVFQSLLSEVFGRPWKLGKAQFGWGGVLVLLLFGIGHGVVFDRSLHLQTSLFAIGSALIPGVMLGWLRERTGSVWPCILVHNVADGLPLLVSWMGQIA